MGGWRVGSFKGIAPRAEPRLLQDNQAQVAVNCKLWHGSLRPIADNAPVGVTLSKAGTKLSLYRFGVSIESDTQYWFHWTQDVDVCRSQISDDSEERTYYTDGTLPKVTDASIAVGGGTGYPVNSYTLGIPAPEALTGSVSGTAGTGLAESRVYTYTYVSFWGEEGKPAEPSVEFTVYPGQTVNLANMATGPSGNYNIGTKRIYRTVTSGSDTRYYFVTEVALATTAFADNILSENLQEELPSMTYSMPPANMRGLCNMANGIMAGFSGKEVCFCEPYKPYAWPLGYRLLTDYEIVAIAALDTTLVVLTKSFPYVIQGTHPESMGQARVDIPQACVSKRSVRVLNGSVVYASPDGLFAIGSGGPPVNLTQVLFTNKEWRSWFKPSSISAYVFDEKYIGFYNNGTTQGGFILDPVAGDFTLLNFYATAGYYDPQRDALFLVVNGELVKFDSGSTNLVASWRSKAFYSPRPINLGAIRVEAAKYPVPVKVYADGKAIGVFMITSRDAQRLPDGFKANVWEFEVSTSFEVMSVEIAQTIRELAG